MISAVLLPVSSFKKTSFPSSKGEVEIGKKNDTVDPVYCNP
jgi:hypothetical protein